MSNAPIITREIASLPERSERAHKGSVGRIVIVGGCANETMMVGAPALAANAALRSGAGLVQMVVPDGIRSAAATLAPCATIRTLSSDTGQLLRIVEEFQPDCVGFGPGLGDSLAPEVVAEFLVKYPGPIVLDADGINQLATVPKIEIPSPSRLVMTPHPGEATRLLRSRGLDPTIRDDAASRQSAARSLAERFSCSVVLKGRGTVVTNGDRLYVNETGNAGMATGGTGDVLTGIIAAFIGQGLEPFEASILGVYLHGLAGDFAAEGLTRWSMTASDVIDHLPEAFSEHQTSAGE